MSYENPAQENDVCPQHELSYEQLKKKQRVKFASLFARGPAFLFFL